MRHRIDGKSDSLPLCIEIGAWEPYGAAPSGAVYRYKEWLKSPDAPAFEFLRPSYRYFFKTGIPRAPAQFWNEVLAFRLGQYLGISVPPTYVAYNTLTGRVGALSEFFGQIDSAARSVLVERRNARRVDFQSIVSWMTFFERNRFLVDDWREFWSQAFLLDSLLGNTDRHVDNWGAISISDASNISRIRFAPLFDNGTSMAYELNESRLAQFVDTPRLLRYVNKGTHQMYWRKEDARRLSHPQFLKRFYAEFPDQRAGIEARLRISDRTLQKVVEGLAAFDVPVLLSRERARAMVDLLRMRRDILAAAIREKTAIC